MKKIRLGRTDLMVSHSGFGALPIQRISFDEAKLLLRKAYDNGINFFDSARQYSDSEEKIGYALADVREDIIIATKSHGETAQDLQEHLETSLNNLKTDYIDIYQFHNKKKVIKPGDEDGLYEAALEAKKQGKIRFIGLTSHSLQVALDAAETDLYDTIQFPLSCISAEEDLELISKCKQADIGVIAMKAMAGGLLSNSAHAFAFLNQYDNVVPIWGVQKEWELDEFLAYEKEAPVLNDEMWEVIRKDREELAADFCRACGYCLPCPVDIPIPMAARMSLLLRRMPWQRFMQDDWRENMDRIKDCIECGQCSSRCPYGLDTPALLKRMLNRYEEFYSQHV